MRDVESLCEEAGLGEAAEVDRLEGVRGVQERFEAFKRRDLYEIRPVAPFLDATFIAARPDGPREGGQVAWGSPRTTSVCWRR